MLLFLFCHNDEQAKNFLSMEKMKETIKKLYNKKKRKSVLYFLQEIRNYKRNVDCTKLSQRCTPLGTEKVYFHEYKFSMQRAIGNFFEVINCRYLS